MSLVSKFKDLVEEIHKEHPELYKHLSKRNYEKFWDLFYQKLANSTDPELKQTVHWERDDFQELILQDSDLGHLIERDTKPV